MKLITRGFLSKYNKPGPVTRGYGKRFIQQIVDVIEDIVRPFGGSKKYRNKPQEKQIDNVIIVTAKLIQVNDISSNNISGSIHAKVSTEYVRSIVEFVIRKTRHAIITASFFGKK